MSTKKAPPKKKKAAVKSLVKAALARFDSYAGPDETPPAPPPKPEPKKAKCKGKCSSCTTCNDKKPSGFEPATDLTGATQLTDADDKSLLFDIYRTADGCIVTRLRGPLPPCAKTCNIVCMLYTTNKLLSDQLNKAAEILGKVE